MCFNCLNHFCHPVIRVPYSSYGHTATFADTQQAHSQRYQAMCGDKGRRNVQIKQKVNPWMHQPARLLTCSAVTHLALYVDDVPASTAADNTYELIMTLAPQNNK